MNLGITLPLIIGSAAVDSINPCAFAVLIFLVMYLMTMKSKKHMLTIGLVYITAIFIVYYLAGLGLLSFVHSIAITKYFYYGSACLSILFGLINIKDFFWYGRGISLAIPESKKELLNKYILRASIPAAIILGVLVALFELPCTGGVYLAIISLLADRETIWQAAAYLLIYNLVFILPLLAIILGVYYGIPPERVEKWRKSQKKLMRLAIGLVMIALGVIMIYI